MTKMKTYNFKYEFNKEIHDYSISVNTEVFKPGVDALYYINTPDVDIASLEIGDFIIYLKPLGSSFLVDETHGRSYTNFIPEYLLPSLDKNAEFNLNNFGISIEDRNHFEFVLYKKDATSLVEYTFDFHKQVHFLDSSIESLVEEIKMLAIYFIQGDFINFLEEEVEDDDFLPNWALDDFEIFAEQNAIEYIAYDTL